MDIILNLSVNEESEAICVKVKAFGSLNARRDTARNWFEARLEGIFHNENAWIISVSVRPTSEIITIIRHGNQVCCCTVAVATHALNMAMFADEQAIRDILIDRLIILKCLSSSG